MPVAAMLLLFSAGCIIIPHRTEVTSAVSVHVINEMTGAPITNAQVRYYLKWAPEHFTSVRSNEQGFFATKSIYQWHWILFIGSPGHYPAPAWMSCLGSPHCFDLVANGFESKQILLDALVRPVDLDAPPDAPNAFFTMPLSDGPPVILRMMPIKEENQDEDNQGQTQK